MFMAPRNPKVDDYPDDESDKFSDLFKDPFQYWDDIWIIDNYYNAKHELQSSIQDVKKYHNGILLDLFENESHPVFKVITNLFGELSDFFNRNKSPDYNFVYDQQLQIIWYHCVLQLHLSLC